MKLKFAIFAISFFATISYMSSKFIFSNPASDNTVMGVSHDLACPCECPMVLEDCHMSCGLDWKDNIGSKLSSGMTKDEIIAYFYKRYGRESLLTPAQRVSGKWYQVTRGGYPLKDIILFILIVAVWTVLIYTVLMLVIESLFLKSSK